MMQGIKLRVILYLNKVYQMPTFHVHFFFNSHEVPNYSSSMSIAVVSSVLNITFHTDNYRYSGIDMFYGCKIFKTKM